MRGLAALGLACLLSGCGATDSRVLELRAGVIETHEPIRVPARTTLRGAPGGTTIHMASDFRGLAAFLFEGDDSGVSNLTIDGNRDALEVRSGLPPYDKPFAAFTENNGILAKNTSHISVQRVQFRNVSGFAILAGGVRGLTIEHVVVKDSGSRNLAGRNNTTGGILIEEGTQDFTVTDCTLERIRGNGIWTHSLYTSARNARGVVARNRFDSVGRDAIQVGHATEVRVEYNRGTRIGFPEDDVDIEGKAYPVAIDTAGNVDHSRYAGNRFTEINGKCIDLDGFHDGEIAGNLCRNSAPPEAYVLGNYAIVMNNTNPDMQSRNVRVLDNLIDGPNFGAIFVIGENNLVARNRFLNLNRAHCNENAARFGCYFASTDPQILEAGIYLGRGAERPGPAKHNRIENNIVTGFKMDQRCVITAPGLNPSANVIQKNACSQ